MVKFWTKAPSGGKNLAFFQKKKKSALWWPKRELKRPLVAKICIFRDFSRFFAIFHDFSRFLAFFQKKKKNRPLVAKTCIFCDFSLKSAIWWRKSELKRHLVAEHCIFRDFWRSFAIFGRFFVIFHDFSRFFSKKRHLVKKKWTKAPSGGQNLHFSQFSAVCLHFSCLFTFLSFQLISQFSAVCLQISCLFTFSVL